MIQYSVSSILFQNTHHFSINLQYSVLLFHHMSSQTSYRRQYPFAIFTFKFRHAFMHSNHMSSQNSHRRQSLFASYTLKLRHVSMLSNHMSSHLHLDIILVFTISTLKLQTVLMLILSSGNIISKYFSILYSQFFFLFQKHTCCITDYLLYHTDYIKYASGSLNCRQC